MSLDDFELTNDTSLSVLEGSSNIEARTQQFKDAIFTSHIDVTELSRIASNGIPDVDVEGQNLRALVWKVMRRLVSTHYNLYLIVNTFNG